TMARIEDAATTVRNEELRLLAIREADAARRSGQANGVLKIAAALGVLIIGVAGWRINREGRQRQVMEAALRDSEMQWRMLVHEVQDYAICMLDPDGRIITWNE